jgi:Ca2+-binding RTX toxin-like protein
MGTITISGTYQQMLTIDGPNTTVNLAKNSEVLSITAGVMLNATATNSTINVNGFVSAPSGAIYALAAGTTVNIGASAELVSAIGVLIAGDDSSVRNRGTINAGGAYGLYDPSGFGNQLRNDGDIFAAVGIMGSGDGGKTINGAGAEIHAVTVGITAVGNAGQHYTIINHGSIRVADAAPAIACGSENDSVTNDGKISGLVFLGSGNDTFDNRGGSYNTTLSGGAGDDTLIVDGAKFKLTENSGEGDDTVKSTVSYKLSANVETLYLLGSKDLDGTGTVLADNLHGNSGNNELKGQAGLDHLYGHKGDDKLIGGADTDYFHFSKGDGHDTVADFVIGTDWIDVHAWNGMDNIDDIKSHAHNQGSDVIIEQGTDSLLIKGYHKADLSMMDFVY